MRTRLDVDAIRTRLLELAEGPPPDAVRGVRGYFEGAEIGSDKFRLQFRYRSRNTNQVYDVRGMIDDIGDWRVVRIDARSRAPFINGWSFAAVVGTAAYGMWEGEVSLDEAAFGIGILLIIFAVANFVFVPAMIMDRTTRLIGAALRGTVFHRGEWVIPRPPD